MLLLLGDEDGNILGQKELHNTCWRLVDDIFINEQEIIVPIHARGIVVRIGFASKDGCLYNSVGSFVFGGGHFVGVDDVMIMQPGRLTWSPARIGLLKRHKLTQQLLLQQETL